MLTIEIAVTTVGTVIIAGAYGREPFKLTNDRTAAGLIAALLPADAAWLIERGEGPAREWR